MKRLVEFIRSIYVVVLFVVLEVAAVGYYARSTCYTQARLLSRFALVAGGVHDACAGVRRYFTLGRENRILTARIAQLEEQLARYDDEAARQQLDSMPLPDLPRFRMLPARVVSNPTGRTQNLLILDRGSRDGVCEGMSVLSSEGAMVGFVIDCSPGYAIALPALHTSFRASGRLAETDYIGSIYWDGADPHTVLLGDVSKYADPQPGQSVVTMGLSEHFPADIPVGTVESAELNQTQTAYTVRVRLTAEIPRLRHVVLVENRDRAEIDTLRTSPKINLQIRPE